jgi:hypothetical protein
MALRDVKPFDEKQMEQLHKIMERGATVKQFENYEKSQRHVKNVKANF